MEMDTRQKDKEKEKEKDMNPGDRTPKVSGGGQWCEPLTIGLSRRLIRSCIRPV